MIEHDNTAYLETYYEMVQAITIRYMENEVTGKVAEYHTAMGHGGLYQLAKELTDKFETMYSGVLWGFDKDWFETIEQFLIEEGI